MTINDMYTKLDKQLTLLNNGGSSYKRLEAIVSRLDELSVNHGSTEVRSDIQNLVKRFSIYKGEESLVEIEAYLNEVYRATASGIKGTEAAEETAGSSTTAKTDRGFWNSRFADFFPLIVSVVVLAIGLSLGLTIFKGNQDGWYFALESFKDIVASLVSGSVAQQVVNRKKQSQNNVAIVIIGSIVGLIALILSVVLLLGANLSVIERFTNWGKLSYMWISGTLCAIAIICSVSVICYLCSYYKNMQKAK